MDLAPSTPGSLPLNCWVHSCPHWCYGQTCFPPTTAGLQHASIHGRTFQRRLYQQLPHGILERVVWFKCEHTYGYLSYGRAEHEAHIATCQHIAAIEAAGEAQAAAAQANPPAETLGLEPYTSICLLCLAEHQLELDTNIRQGTAMSDMQGLLIAWLSTAQAALVAHGDH